MLLFGEGTFVIG